MNTTTSDYHVGETWLSFDNGITWEYRHFFKSEPVPDGGKAMVIVAIDHVRGRITVEISR